jgi:hypothetical protein
MSDPFGGSTCSNAPFGRRLVGGRERSSKPQASAITSELEQFQTKLF